MRVPISANNTPPSLLAATQWAKMAYNSHSTFDIRSQILENLKFVSWKSAQLKTLTARDPLGNYKVIVTIDEDEGRRPFLAETGETFQKALEALHNKSADLVHRHIETVGFEYRRRSRKKSPKSPNIVDDSDDGLLSASSDGSDGSQSPTLALSEVESADEAASDEDDIVSVISDVVQKRASKLTSKSSTPKPAPPKPPMASQPRVNQSDLHSRQSPIGRANPPLPPPGAPRNMSHPPPPPGWRAGPPAPPRPASISFPSPPAPPLPPPVLTLRQQMQPPPAGSQSQVWDVRISIKFPGRGDAHVLASVRASGQELRRFALDYVLKNPGRFRSSKPQLEQLRLQTLVKRVVLGQVGYDVSTYPKDDLTKLFTAASTEGSDVQMPLVEVEVWPQSHGWANPAPVIMRSPPSSPPMTIVD